MLADNLIVAEAKETIHYPIKFSVLKFIGFLIVPQFAGSIVYQIVLALYPNIALENSESLFLLFSTGLTTLTVILYTTKVDKLSYRAMGFSRQGRGKSYGMGLLLGFAMMVVLFMMNYLTGAVSIESNFAHADINWLILFFVGYMIQGMSEEVLLRSYGMTYWTLESKNKRILYGVYMNSLLFAGLHLFNPGITVLSFINLLLFGVFASLVYYVTENIWLISALHSLWNFTQGLVFGVLVSGTANATSVFKTSFNMNLSWLNGGSFGFEGGLWCTVLLGFSIYLVWLLIRKKGLWK